jgi:hypothetical protein
MNFKDNSVPYKKYGLTLMDPIKYSIETATQSTVRVYSKIQGKLAMWDVATESIPTAIQTVKEVEQLNPKHSVLALIK